MLSSGILDMCSAQSLCTNMPSNKLGCYLKATSDKGLIMKPTEKLLKTDSFPYDDFAWKCGHEAMDDPVCVKSRTGYMITVANCPIMWQSKLHSGTALSTMESKIVVKSHGCHELFPIMDEVSIMGKAIGLSVGDTNIQVLVHKDNAGALVLATTLLSQFTSQSKHYNTKIFGFERRLWVV